MESEDMSMFTDITGRRRLKVGLHTHTTITDGRKSPEEAAAIYKEAGYDALAITDHWAYHAGGELGGLTILSGAEYNVCGLYTPAGRSAGIVETYHVVGVGMTREPELPLELMHYPGMAKDGCVRDAVRRLVSAIREAGGLAILAHPAWSVNTPEQIMDCGDFDGTEIYNSTSDWGMNDRPYSGIIVDQLATLGYSLPLLATDDTHQYNGDQCRGAVMVEADAVEELGMVEALRRGRYYATMGPEVHTEWVSEDTVRIRCTPVSKISVLSNMPWVGDRMARGMGLTEFDYTVKSGETYVRVEVTDTEGRVGFSHVIQVNGH
jgi:hypothetical protein